MRHRRRPEVCCSRRYRCGRWSRQALTRRKERPGQARHSLRVTRTRTLSLFLMSYSSWFCFLLAPVRFSRKANLPCFPPAALLVTDVASFVPQLLLSFSSCAAACNQPPYLAHRHTTRSACLLVPTSAICYPACTTSSPKEGSESALFPCLPHEDAHFTSHFHNPGLLTRALVHRLYHHHINGHLHMQHTDSLYLSARIPRVHLSSARAI